MGCRVLDLLAKITIRCSITSGSSIFIGEKGGGCLRSISYRRFSINLNQVLISSGKVSDDWASVASAVEVGSCMLGPELKIKIGGRVRSVGSFSFLGRPKQGLQCPTAGTRLTLIMIADGTLEYAEQLWLDIKGRWHLLWLLLDLVVLELGYGALKKMRIKLVHDWVQELSGHPLNHILVEIRQILAHGGHIVDLPEYQRHV